MKDFHRQAKTVAVLLVLVPAFMPAGETSGKDSPPEYLRDVKPLLKSRCYRCHGPDDQQSDLRLDTAEAAMEGGISGPAVVAGDSGTSLLIQAVSGTSADVSRMPPEGEGDPLTEDQIQLLRRWIDAGAAHPADERPTPPAPPQTTHWSFAPIRRPPLPTESAAATVHNPIDAFVAARLGRHGFDLAPPADRVTLIRRLSLDLLGLPPSIEDVDRFVADRGPDAYGRLVDRMLASPRYGERWGRHWLDLARYADSDGYTNDVARVMWKYRDWVLDALNRDMPFDRFTIEQFAGDLLEGATTDQIVATGFHRNTQRNREGGSDAEQYRVEAIVDRVSTTGVVFLGLTLGCARCHDHKYDPVSQREFYEMFAFLNNQDEPLLTVPIDDREFEVLEDLQTKIARSEKELKQYDAEAVTRLADWEREIGRGVTWAPVAVETVESAEGVTLTELDDGSILAGGEIPESDTYTMAVPPGDRVTAVRLEVLTHPSLPGTGPGLASNGNFLLHEVQILTQAAVDEGSETRSAEHRIARAGADHSQPNFPVSQAIDGDSKTGWAINVGGTQSPSIHTDRTAAFILRKPALLSGEQRLVIRLHQNQDHYLIGRFRISVTSAPPSVIDAAPSDEILEIVRISPAERTAEQQQKVLAEFQQRDPERAILKAQLDDLRRRESALKKQATTTTLVMRERTQPRATFVHIRGDFLRQGKQVAADVPAALPPMDGDARSPNRLDLAHWLVSRENPLTARVTVNRIWQRFFGKGIVETENDFGTQGTPPSHPQLLDWLAAEFVAQGWSVKHLQRLIVASATYRQSSRLRPELAEIDANNRLLGRQNRLRVEAEVLRDTALSAAGLLSTKMHGPGVFPPQPAGVMKMTRNPNRKWVVSQGEDRYRRGLYTYFWRSTPHPFLKLFNAPESNTTCTRRDRSNTPLQALTLLNDEAFVEAAQALALRVMQEHPAAAPRDVLTAMFRRCLARTPNERELAALTALYDAERQGLPGEMHRFPATATLPEGIDARRFTALTTVARTLMNVDEFITRE